MYFPWKQKKVWTVILTMKEKLIFTTWLRTIADILVKKNCQFCRQLTLCLRWSVNFWKELIDLLSELLRFIRFIIKTSKSKHQTNQLKNPNRCRNWNNTYSILAWITITYINRSRLNLNQKMYKQYCNMWFP